MSLEDELQPASYKGASFLVSTSNISGGRKDVKHSFPNSDKQTIEDLGLSPRIFTLTGVISGNNYTQNRDRLIAKLEEGGPGVLIHPFYGRLDNYVLRTYTLNETMTELGEARFNMTFEISNVEGQPEVSENSIAGIEDANDAYVTSISNDIGNNFSVTSSFTGNYSDASNKLTNVSSAFSNNTTFLQASITEINGYNTQITNFNNSINSFINAPATLGAGISELFDSIDSLYDSVEDTIDIFGKFFGFGEDDTQLKQTTLGLQERKKNRDLINTAIQSIALSYSYFNAAQIEFETIEDIEALSDRLEQQYQKIKISNVLETDTLELLTDLRTELQTYFNEQRLVARQTITINVNKIPARVLAYKYYKDSTYGERILNLNSIGPNTSFIEGNIKILTE